MYAANDLATRADTRWLLWLGAVQFPVSSPAPALGYGYAINLSTPRTAAGTYFPVLLIAKESGRPPPSVQIGEDRIHGFLVGPAVSQRRMRVAPRLRLEELGLAEGLLSGTGTVGGRSSLGPRETGIQQHAAIIAADSWIAAVMAEHLGPHGSPLLQ